MRWMWLAALALALPPSLTARAWTVNSDDPNIRGWGTTVLKVNIDPTNCPDGITQLVYDAMQTWNGVQGADISLALGNTASATSAHDARAGNAVDSPVITCDTSFHDTTNMDPNSVPGVGGISIDTNSRRIIYGYMVLNAEDGAQADVRKLDKNRLTIVVAHELGHLLGLGHSTDPNAIMYPNVTFLPAPKLSDDDIAGLKHLYPPGGADQGTGCGTVTFRDGTGPDHESHDLASFISFLLLCAVGSCWMRETKTVTLR